MNPALITLLLYFVISQGEEWSTLSLVGTIGDEQAESTDEEHLSRARAAVIRIRNQGGQN